MVRLEIFAVLAFANVIAAQFFPWQTTNDYPDILPDDTLAFLFSNRNSLFPENYAPCVVQSTGMTLEGTCSHSPDCKFSGGRGQSRGNCSLINTCCTYQKSCGQTVRSRVSYFTSPTTPRLATDRTCRLTVQTTNENICQIRVDIINMILSDPIANMGAGTMSTVTCGNDTFTVNPQPSVAIPPLCGTNTNTHFYIHLAPGQRQVNLEMFLRAMGSAVGSVGASWNMKITQLECPSREKRFDVTKKKENRNQAFLDFQNLAPAGCLQYYTERSGVVKSFGFETTATAMGDSTLTTGQNYAACFKSYGNCGQTFTNNALLLRNMDPMCMGNIVITIPEGKGPDGMVDASPVCEMAETIVAMQPITAQHPGPQYIHFRDDFALGTFAPTLINGGFSLNYDTISNC